MAQTGVAVWTVAAALGLAAVCTQGEEPTTMAFPWKAGIARVAITPRTGVWLAGYGTRRAPEGTLHDLWAKTLALEDASGRRVVLVTTDHMGVPKGMYEDLCRRAAQRFGLARSQLMVAFSHNHCGPCLRGDLVDYYPADDEQRRLVSEYTDLNLEQLLQSIAGALADLAPARLAQGEGTATFAVNRRNNPEAEVAAWRAAGKPLQGPVDHSVPILAVYRGERRLDAVLFGYACHPTTLSFTQWCGDYPGFAQLALEQAHPGLTALFLNTCGGDQNPLPRRTVELCAAYGERLAEGVEGALRQPLRPVSGELRTAFEFADLAYDTVVTRDALQGFSQSANAIQARWAKRLLGELDRGAVFEASYPYPVQAWGVGTDLLLIGIGGEAVVDYALRFKREFGPGTWVCGYANDLVAYIPSRRVWEEGGYEGGPHLDEYGRPALRWAGDVEDRVASAVRRVVAAVRP